MTIDKLNMHHRYVKHHRLEKYTPEMRVLCKEIEDFIKAIEDDLIYDVLYYRYVLGYTWVMTAKMFGDMATPDCYRNMAKRYLAKHLNKLPAGEVCING